MYTPFLIVDTLAGAPPFLVAALLAYFSNLSAGLTHCGTTSGPIYHAKRIERLQELAAIFQVFAGAGEDRGGSGSLRRSALRP